MNHKAHFIVAAVGTAGDTLPLVALAKELQRAGHDVDFLAFDAFASIAENAGLTFHRVGDAGLYEHLARDATVWFWHTGFSSLWRYLAAAMPDTFAHVERLRRADSVLVGSSGAVGMRLAQEKFAMPLATVHMSPFYFFSRRDNVLGGLGAWPAWCPLWLRNVVMRAIDRGLIDGSCRADVNDLRAKLGLPPVQQIFTRWMHSPDKVICAVPAWFAPPQADWPRGAVSISFPIDDSAEQWKPDDKLTQFLAAGPPPVLFSAGTGAGAALTFFQRAVDAARLSGRRAILVTRWPELIAQPLPDNVLHIDHAPFSHLFSRAAAIVHNGGIGTIALAMQAGIPQVIVPFAYDQFYNGHRLAALGGGIVIRRQRNAHELATAIDTVVNSQSMRASCEQNRQRMRESARGVADMAQQVESLV